MTTIAETGTSSPITQAFGFECVVVPLAVGQFEAQAARDWHEAVPIGRMKPFASDIEVDAVEPLRQRPSADPVPCFEHEHRQALPRKRASGGKASRASSNYDHMHGRIGLHHRPSCAGQEDGRTQ
jgi:hypothetical protein